MVSIANTHKLHSTENKHILMEKYHKALIANHIYAAKFTCGIRIAICGLPLKKCQGLAGRLMDILQEVTND